MRFFFRFSVMMTLACALGFGAGIDGKWNFSFETPVGVREGVWEFRSNGKELVAKAANSEEQVKGTFENKTIALSFELFSEDAGYKATMSMKGKLEGDKIVGKWIWDTYTGSMNAARVE